MKIPQTYNEADQSEDSREWKQAMKKELEALKESKTFELSLT